MISKKSLFILIFILLAGSSALLAQGALGPLMINPNPIDFGDVMLGVSSQIPVYISKENPYDTTPTGINSISVSGSPFFTEEHSFPLPSSFSTMETKTVFVNFNPTTAGPCSGTLTIVNPYMVTYNIPITGNCLAPIPEPILTINPDPVLYTIVEQTGRSIAATFTNTGSAPLSFTLNTSTLPTWLSFNSSEISGKHGSMRNISDTLAVGDSVTIPVNFHADTLTPGSYFYYVNITTNESTPYRMWSIYLTVEQMPIRADFTATPLNLHVGGSVQFYDTSVIDTTVVGSYINSRSWDFDDDGTWDSTLQNPTHRYLSTGLYTVMLHVTTNLGASDDEYKNNYINVTNNPPVAADSMDAVSMDEDTTWGPASLYGLFSDPDGDPMTFLGQSASHVNVNVTGTSYSILIKSQWSGTETVYITATDFYGASTQHAITVTVNPVNDPPTVSVPSDIYFINDSHLSVNFGDYVDDIDNPDSEISMTINHIIAGENDVSVVYTASTPGALTAVFTNSVANWSGFNEFEICFDDNSGLAICTHVNLHSLDHFTTSFTFNDSLNLAGQTVQFTDTTLGNPDWFQWDFNNDGTPDSFEQNPAHQFLVAGDYTIRYTMGNTEAAEQGTAVTPTPFHVVGTALVGDLPPNLPIGGSPYNVVDSLFIPAGGTSIDPGVVLNFLGNDPIVLSGNLSADGAYFQAPPGSNYWGGFVFGEGSQGSNFDGCHFLDALIPLDLNGFSPTLTDLEIAVSDTTQFFDEPGVIMNGSSGILNNIRLRNYRRGILINNSNRTTTTPTLTNIRVRNSTETTRDPITNTGLTVEGDVNVTMTDVEVINCSTGIHITNLDRATTTPTLTNIRVRNSTETSRTGNYGIDLLGDINATISDAVLEDCGIGIRYDKGGGIVPRTGSTPTLTNIRVRNSSETQRSASIGIQLIDLTRVTVTNDSIGNCTKAIEVINNARVESTPTLTNIRIRNSNETQRFDNIGIHLHPGVTGKISGCDIRGAFVGIQLEDGARPDLQQNLIKNCGTGIRAFSSVEAVPISRQVFSVENTFMQANPLWTFRAIDLNDAGPWLVNNNTIFGYPKLLRATNATVNFSSNIGWGWNGIDTPLEPVSSTIDANYNDVWWAQGVPIAGTGNILADPVFVNPALDDFRITYDSPCIDAGSPQLPHDPDGTITDIGAITYLHRASMVGDHRFVITGSTVNFTNTSIGHGPSPETHVYWDLGNDGSIESINRDWSYTFNTPGLYDIRLKMQTGSLIDEVIIQRAVVVQNLQLMPPVIHEPVLEGRNIHVNWEPVLQTMGHEPVDVSFYLVFHGDTPNGEFHYLGFTAAPITTYLHRLGADLERQFYFVIGFAGTRNELQNYIETHGTINSRGQVIETIKERQR
ncbi:MAG TPA: PKD domain-containing protein [Candidatus Cloacimonadota bacterium]|nr:PKD domain-containing protein [Candidatus Cloacimonadota bacterium]